MSTELLRTLATNFGSNSLLAAKSIREFYRLDPAGFGPAAAEVLREEPDLPGAQFLVAILIADPGWLRSVCDSDRHTLEESLELIQRAQKMDPLTVLKLADTLASSGFATDAEARFTSRVFAVLKRCPPATVLPAFRRLSKCSNPRVRSKAVLLLGRVYKNPKLAEQGAPESDPRVLSNAVEALWGLDTAIARGAFLKASMDEHHRIAANGIVGLHMMGEASAIPLLFRLSRSEAPLCRAAAAWAMAHLEDPRFLPRLTELMKDSDPVTRQKAFRSAARLRQLVDQMQAAATLVVQLREVEIRDSVHAIRFVVEKNVDNEQRFLRGLDRRQMVIWNGPDVVEEFSMSLLEGDAPCYEVTYRGAPSSNGGVKIQVFAAEGAGEDGGAPEVQC